MLMFFLPTKVSPGGFGRVVLKSVFYPLICLLLFPLAAHAQDTVRLQLKWTHAFQFAGYYAAQERGYYREAGFDVSFQEATPETDPIEIVVSGKAQYGIGNSSLVIAHASGKPVVVLAVVFQQSPCEIYAAPGIRSLRDLIGKRLMLEPNSDELLVFLKKEGIPIDSIQLIQHSFDPQDLTAGRTDAISGYISNEPYYFAKSDYPYQTFNPRKAGIDFYGDNLFTSEQELRDNPERVKAFRAASLRGWKYARDHVDEMIHLITTRYSKVLTPDYLHFESDQMIPLLQPTLIEIGYMNTDRWQHIADTYASLGLIPAGYSPEGFMYKADEPDLTFFYRSLIISLLLILSVSGVALYIFSINRRLANSIKKSDMATTALGESEKRWRSIVKTSPDGIAITSIDGIIKQVSDKSVFMFGFNAPDEIMGRNIVEFVDPAFHENVKSKIDIALVNDLSGAYELQVLKKDGTGFYIESNVSVLRNAQGEPTDLIHIFRDITGRKQIQDAIQDRIIALTLPLSDDKVISFSELFNLADIQRIQDDFAAASGVASLITLPDGTPITQPSRFTRFCSNIVRQTEKGCANCLKSDVLLGSPNLTGPTVRPCLSGGLWDAGTSIYVGGHHIANWLVGQVRDETQTDESVLAYAREIGTDEGALLKAFHEVPAMSRERFLKVAQSLYTLANQLSATAYQNLQQSRFIAEHRQVEEQLRETRDYLENLLNYANAPIIVWDTNLRITQFNKAFEHLSGRTEAEVTGREVTILFPEAARLQSLSRIQQASTGDRWEVVEIDIQHVDGSIRTLLWNSASLSSSDGSKVIATIAQGQDITDRVKVEKALKESEIKFRMLFSQMSEGFALHEVIYDADQKAIDYKIVDLNPAFEKQLGIDGQQATGKPASLVYSVSPAPYLELYAEVAATGKHHFFQSYFPPLDSHFEISVFSPKPGYFATIFTNITDRKRTETALLQSEQRYRLLFDNSIDSFMLTGIDGSIQSVNPATCRMFGRTEAEICQLGRNVLVDNTDPRLQVAIEERARTGKFVGEIICIRKNGERFPAEIASIVFTDAEGRSHTSMILRDITERKNAENTLRETRDYLENLLNYANAPIIVWDSNLLITQFNKAFERLSGRNEADVVGKEVALLFPDATRQQSLNYIQQASTGDRWEVVEIEIQHTSGQIRTLLWNSASLFSHDGTTVIATIAQGQDITERKQAEDKLKESEERFRLLLNSSAEGIYGVDTSGNCTFCNSSALKILGYHAIEDVLGQNMHALIHHTRIDGTHCPANECRIFSAFINETEAHVDDEVFWTKSGNWFHTEYWSYPIFREERIIGSVVTFFDISERKKVQEALLESERQKATLISNLPGFVYRCAYDRSWTMMYISEGCKTITGYEPSDFLSNMKLSFNDIIHPDFVDLVWQKWQNSLEAKKSFHGEYQIIHANGETRWVWEQGQGISAEDGTLLYLEGFITDITERKLIQEAIRESEEKLRTIIETSPDGISITSMDGIIQSVSPQIVSMWGYASAEEMIGRNVLEFLHPDYREKAIYFITEMINGHLTGANEYLMVRKDGSTFYIEANANILKDSNDAPIGILYIERDISERKIAEQILRESEEQHRLLFETAREGIVVVQGAKLSFFNPMMPEITGYTSEELSIMDFADLIYPDDREVLMNNYMRRLEGEMVEQRNNYRIVRNDGSLRWIEMSGVKIDWKGAPATLNFINDITEHKLAEEALRESEARLRELNATKDKFFSIIAHDLKSPFNNILSLSNLLVEQVEKKETESVDEFATLIQNSSQRAVDLLLNLLEWSRSQTGRMEFSPVYVELRSLIHEVTELASDTARLKSITISTQMPHNILMMADKAMMSTVLRNLISNAIKFTRPGGRIIISALQEKQKIVVSVSDNGVGIKSESLKKLFRIEASLSTKGTGNESGTGLGLILCKEFVEKHGGEIWVESTQGKGSTFYFSVPRN